MQDENFIDVFFTENYAELLKIAKSCNRQFATDLVADLYFVLKKYKDQERLKQIISSQGAMAYCSNVIRNTAKRNYIFNNEVEFSETHQITENKKNPMETILNEMDSWIQKQKNLHQLIWKLYYGRKKIKIRKLCRETGLDERYIRNKRNLLINEFKKHLQNKNIIE